MTNGTPHIENDVSVFFAGHELEINVTQINEDTYEQGDSGVTIFAAIKNKTKKKISVEVDETYIINSQKIQREKDFYLTGYYLESAQIAANSTKIRGDIYLYSRTGKFNKDWIFCIYVTDKSNAKKYEVSFRLESKKQWSIISCEIIEESKIISTAQKRKELQNSIEQIETFEEKMGVRLDNITLSYNKDNRLWLYFDVYEINPGSVTESFWFKVVLYDCQNQIIKSESTYISSSSFMGFDSMGVYLGEFSAEELNELQKIRLFITK